MKKNKFKAYITAIFICLAYLTQLNGYAQAVPSKADIEFKAGTGPTYPVNPEEPGTDGGGEPTYGSLAIVDVSYFDFGIIPLSPSEWLFEIKTTMPNIQVVDLRGTAAGWKVSATMTRFNDGERDTLPGAAIHIIDGRPNSLSESLPPVQKPNTILTADGEPTEVLSAASGAGTGLWVMRWYPASGDTYVKLEIPTGTATTGSHTATINWILGDTP